MNSRSQASSGPVQFNQELFSETLADALARGESVWLRVQGVSMLPWLREGDPVCVRPAEGRRLHRGDIALFWREPRHPILHRIVRVRRTENGIVADCLGDSECGQPESVSASDIIGVVETMPVHRWIYRMLNPPRRLFNRLCQRWGLRLRHG